MANKYIKGLTELTSIVDADHLIFQPDSASQIANRITFSNFISGLIFADGSIDTHSDVDISTSAPSEGDVIIWRTDEFVPEAPSVVDDTTKLSKTLTPDQTVASNVEFLEYAG